MRRGAIDLKTWCEMNSAEQLLDEWDIEKNCPLRPETVAHGSELKVWWRCPKQHCYEARISNRTHGKGCPYCSNHKTLEGFNDFKTWCIDNRREDLLDQWNYVKNDLSPSQISPQNGKKIWWKCSAGHEWEATIGSRTGKKRQAGCPYCSTPPKKVLVGYNDFESWCKCNGKEDLLEEWNYDRNDSVDPKKITYGSGKTVWWKCRKGHEWRASPGNRVQGTGCPVCSRTQTSFPEQAIAFYLSKSFRVLQRYRLRGYEIDIFLEDYSLGIEYDGLFFHSKNKMAIEQKKDMFFQEQGINLIRIKENKEKTGREGRILFYIPGKSNYLDNTFNEMLHSLIELVERITGTTAYKDIDIIRDELVIRYQYSAYMRDNSVAALFPELVPEWDVEKNSGMTADNFSANAHTKVWWKCKRGHSWQAVISSRSKGLGCPFCAGQRTIAGENDFESWCTENAPGLLEEWNAEKNILKPSDVAKTSNKKVWWKCSKGHEWEAVIANRVHGTRCPFCFTGKSAKRKDESLADWCRNNGRPQLLDEWNYEKNDSVTPESVSKGSHLVVWWKCSAGHEWEAEVKSRTYNHGCPYCSRTNKKALPGINDLVTWCKENGKDYILDEWDYLANGELKPEMFTPGSHQRIYWKCSKGHKWSAVIKERTKQHGNMCPECKIQV